ncbi:hypothetical protein V1477_013435 [Vespula maculifrons]|uniref:Uncharacterized protein n=1 Tax=Vespula maculifrons TaxID=7453 RepID=A0ABD2BQH2_VESMC
MSEPVDRKRRETKEERDELVFSFVISSNNRVPINDPSLQAQKEKMNWGKCILALEFFLLIFIVSVTRADDRTRETRNAINRPDNSNDFVAFNKDILVNTKNAVIIQAPMRRTVCGYEVGGGEMDRQKKLIALL